MSDADKAACEACILRFIPQAGHGTNAPHEVRIGEHGVYVEKFSALFTWNF